MSVLELVDVDAYYGKAQILHGVSLQVEAGEAVALLGRNGAGKTTTLRTCFRLTRLGRGEVRVAGAPAREKPYLVARQGIALVPQGRGIIGGLTVEENLLVGRHGRDGRWGLDEVYEFFPALARARQRPGTSLSGGEQQMLALGRALLGNPSIILLDEPTEGLAPVVIEALIGVLRELGARGTALLIVEQNLAFARETTQRFYVMQKGQMIEEGATGTMTVEALQRHVAV